MLIEKLQNKMRHTRNILKELQNSYSYELKRNLKISFIAMF